MRKKYIVVSILLFVSCPFLTAQDSVSSADSKLKISGSIQTQFQYGEAFAGLQVGSPNEKPGEEAYSRIGIRRGRIKLDYSEKITTAVFQLDITEKGIGVKDAYLQISVPRTNNILSFKGGIFNRPFGYEIAYSSTQRESPERSRIFQTLFPGERDLGLMVILQMPEKHPLHFLNLQAGWFGGNGINWDTDNKKDFITRLAAKHHMEGWDFGLGLSYYNGKVYNATIYDCEMQGKAFKMDSTASAGHFLKREYLGFDMQVSREWLAGKTTLLGEYLWGIQPGFEDNSKSPNYADVGTIEGKIRYTRPISGFYTYLIHDFRHIPFSLVAKYDVYDPNTKVAKNDIGLAGSGTTATDLKYQAFGLGMLWHCNAKLRLQAYYEFVRNETTVNIAQYAKDINDNVFTLRLQYKF